MGTKMLFLITLKNIISYLTCLIIYKIIIKKRFTRYWIIIFDLIIFDVMYIFLNSYIPVEFIGDLLSIFLIGLMYKDKTNKKIRDKMLVYIIWELEQTIISIIVDTSFSLIYENIIEQLIDLAIFSILYISFKINMINLDKIKFNEKLKNITMFVFITTMSFILFLVILSDYTYKNNEFFATKGIYKILMPYFIISVVLITLLFGLLLLVNRFQSKILEYEKNFNQMQKIYYEMNIDNDNKTKKFRHDITNHLLYIYNIAKKQKNTEIINYIEGLKSEFGNNIEKIRDVGDETINILVNYYVSNLDREVEVIVSGGLQGEFIESPLITVLIIGNILKNATHELEKKSNTNIKKKLCIEFSEGDKFKKVKVINTIVNLKSNLNRGNKKKGYGVPIIEENVKKCKGIYNHMCIDNFYEVEIIVPK